MTLDLRSSLRNVVAAGAIALSVLLLVPFEPVLISSDTPSGWSTRIVEDLAVGRRFGVDTVFNYGPLGLVPLRAYFPGLFVALLIGWVSISTAFIGSSLRVLRDSGLSFFQSALLTGLLTVIVTSQISGVGTEPALNLLIAFVPLLALLRRDESPDPYLRSLLGLALAIASLGKFNYFVGATGVIAVATLVDLVRRRPPYISLVFVTSLLVLWKACGQAFADLPSFVRFSFESSQRYGEAMSLTSQARDAVLFTVLAAVMILACVGSIDRGESRFERRALQLSWAFWVFLVYKTAVVRQDEHVLSASVTLLGAGILLLATSRKEPGLARSTARVSIALALTGAIISLAGLGAQFTDELSRPPLLAVRQLRAAGRLIIEPGSLERAHRANLAALASSHPLPRVGATVDILPFSSALPLAHGLTHRPNPVVNSYNAAHSPAFAAMQVAHLHDASGPEVLFASLETLDDRYPSLDYGPSLLEILGRFEVIGRQGTMLILKRRLIPRKVGMSPLMTASVKPGEAVNFASRTQENSIVWARVRVEGSPARSLYATLYRAPVFQIRATRRDGSVSVHRFIPAGGEAGFLLSPYLDDQQDFENFLRGSKPSASPIASISIEVEPTLVPYADSLTVELFTLDIHQ